VKKAGTNFYSSALEVSPGYGKMTFGQGPGAGARLRNKEQRKEDMTFIYPAVFHKREDGKYEGRFVDLAMCYGVGDTLDEAIRDCIEAEREWIQLELREEEWDIPEVTNIHDIELKEGEIVRNIAAKVRILEGWEE
jgi:predicted RNase H-like HicB family nuclease